MDAKHLLLMQLQDAKEGACDAEHVDLLERAIIYISGKVCLRCRDRKPEVRGVCRPCYQSTRRQHEDSEEQ